jgi:sugar phosphate isomerase/epimerase
MWGRTVRALMATTRCTARFARTWPKDDASRFSLHGQLRRVGVPSSGAHLAGTWLSASHRRLAWRLLGRLLRLADLLGMDLVVRSASLRGLARRGLDRPFHLADLLGKRAEKRLWILPWVFHSSVPDTSHI